MLISQSKVLLLNFSFFLLLVCSFLVVPVRPSGRSMFTNTVTDARVLHPSMTSYSVPSIATISNATLTATSGHSRYASGIISRLDGSLGPALTPSSHTNRPTASIVSPHVDVVTKVSASPKFSNISSLSSSAAKLSNETVVSTSTPLQRPRSSYMTFSSQTLTNTTDTNSAFNSVGLESLSAVSSSIPSATTATQVSNNQSYGILSSLYKYMRPAPATTTINSGISSIISEGGLGERNTARGAYGRWQSPW